MTPTPRRSRSLTRRSAALAAATVLSLSVLLAGCSADSGSSDSSAQDAGAAAAVGDSGAQAPAAGDDAAASTADEQRQVIQTGEVRMTVENPTTTAEAVVTLTEKAGGRVDDRTEHAATSQDAGTAELTIRLPANAVTGALDELRALGTVDEINLSAQDVTGAAQDLDARIHGLQISVARMEDLLDKATTSADVIAAEGALSERQTNLEQLQSERARLAEQVSLSTLKISLYGPALAPAAQTSGPDSFLDGITAGWDALVVVVQGVVVVLGVLLPWLVVAGLVTWGVVVLQRRYRRSHPRRQPPSPPTPAYALAARVPVGAGAPGPTEPPAAPPVTDPDAR